MRPDSRAAQVRRAGQAAADEATAAGVVLVLQAIKAHFLGDSPIGLPVEPRPPVSLGALMSERYPVAVVHHRDGECRPNLDVELAAR